MIIILIILGILLGTATYVIINLLRKFNRLQNKYVNLLDNISQHLKAIDSKREEIDKHNYFEYDENMQFVYSEIAKLIDELNQKYNDHI